MQFSRPSALLLFLLASTVVTKVVCVTQLATIFHRLTAPSVVIHPTIIILVFLSFFLSFSSDNPSRYPHSYRLPVENCVLTEEQTQD